MINLKIGVPGDPAINRVLGLLAEVVGDMSDIWRAVVHPFILDHMSKQFDTSGAHGGRQWAVYPTEPAYAAYKLSIVGHLRPLVWQWGGTYEVLRPSLMEPGHPLHVFQATPTKVRVGTSVPYAKSLNEGGTGPFGEPFPARKIMAMTPGQKKALITKIQRAIVEKLGPGTRDRSSISFARDDL